MPFCFVHVRMRILDASIGAPGSCNDSAVWEATPTFKSLLRPDVRGWRGGWVPPGYFISADMAYKLRPFQLRPFKEPEIDTSSKEAESACIAYNLYLRRVRRVVERVFGVLKKRFICLIAPKEDNLEHRIQDTWAACILHNILLDYNYPVDRNPVYEDGGYALSVAMRELKEALAAAHIDGDGLDDLRNMGLDPDREEDVLADEDVADGDGGEPSALDESGVQARHAVVGQLQASRQSARRRGGTGPLLPAPMV